MAKFMSSLGKLTLEIGFIGGSLQTPNFTFDR
jgi:hypothetical protein